MKYSDLINRLTACAEEEFADFQRRLIFTKYTILGVRTPILHKLAKEHMAEFEEIFAFPNEYYEVVAIKLFQAAALPYDRFVEHLEDCVSFMDNWALCDGFKARCIKARKEEYLTVLRRLFAQGGEYQQRYPLVVLLTEYVEPTYLETIRQFIKKADTSRYYVYMAVAWLLAEVIIKDFHAGISLLNMRIADKKTHNKAIQKAIESYRLTNEQKEFLCSLKIRN